MRPVTTQLVLADLPRVVRERVALMGEAEQDAFAERAFQIVMSYRTQRRNWWALAKDLNDETFLADTTLERLHAELTRDLQLLLPGKDGP